MIKREWQSLLKNKFMIVVVIAIMIIPTIYTTIFLGSMWDPYGEVDKLPVAIVNEDLPVVYNDKTMEVGNELVDNLKENNSLDFNFVDKDVAEEGLENGTYYMVVTIPKDFSNNATTLMDDEPKQMELKYETNPGTNYIASKLSQTAISKIRTSIQEKITKQYAETIFDNIETLGDGLNDAADGTKTALDGVDKLKSGNKEITDNLNLLASSSLEFKDGAETLKVGLKKYTDGATTAKDGSNTLSAGISEYTAGVNTAKNGSNELLAGLSEINNQIPTLSNGVGSLTANSALLNDGVNELSDGAGSILAGLKTMSSQIDKSMSKENVEKIKTAQSGLLELNKQIQNMNTDLQDSSSGSTAVLLNKIMNTEAYKSLNADEKKELLTVLNESNNEMKENVSKLAAASNLVLPGSNDAITQLSSGLTNVQTALDRVGDTEETMGLIQGMNKIDAGLNDSTKGLKVGIKAYTDGVGEIASKIPSLTGGVDKLYTGSKSLSEGLSTLNSKSPELNSGVLRLSDGLKELTANNDTLLNGVSRLSDGAVSINDGSSKLAEGSNTLGSGLSDLYDGVVELNDGLSDGAEKVNDLSASDNTYEMMANPVDTTETQITKIDNNGNAMAPYMMCVGLWVACIAFCIMYPLTSYEGKMENGFKWWLSKASILGIVTIAQAIIMVFMLKGINGLDPVELGKVILIACLASVTFMSMMYFFNILMGKVGSFIMLIFMVLQLGGCGGTYPLELASKFYSVINPFMPFTYCVHAFRSAISGGASIIQDIAVLVLLLAVFIALTIGVFAIKARIIINEENRGKSKVIINKKNAIEA